MAVFLLAAIETLSSNADPDPSSPVALLNTCNTGNAAHASLETSAVSSIDEKTSPRNNRATGAKLSITGQVLTDETETWPLVNESNLMEEMPHTGPVDTTPATDTNQYPDIDPLSTELTLDLNKEILGGTYFSLPINLTVSVPCSVGATMTPAAEVGGGLEECSLSVRSSSSTEEDFSIISSFDEEDPDSWMLVPPKSEDSSVGEFADEVNLLQQETENELSITKYYEEEECMSPNEPLFVTQYDEGQESSVLNASEHEPLMVKYTNEEDGHFVDEPEDQFDTTFEVADESIAFTEFTKENEPLFYEIEEESKSEEHDCSYYYDSLDLPEADHQSSSSENEDDEKLEDGTSGNSVLFIPSQTYEAQSYEAEDLVKERSSHQYHSKVGIGESLNDSMSDDMDWEEEHFQDCTDDCSIEWDGSSTLQWKNRRLSESEDSTGGYEKFINDDQSFSDNIDMNIVEELRPMLTSNVESNYSVSDLPILEGNFFQLADTPPFAKRDSEGKCLGQGLMTPFEIPGERCDELYGIDATTDVLASYLSDVEHSNCDVVFGDFDCSLPLSPPMTPDCSNSNFHAFPYSTTITPPMSPLKCNSTSPLPSDEDSSSSQNVSHLFAVPNEDMSPGLLAETFSECRPKPGSGFGCSLKPVVVSECCLEAGPSFECGLKPVAATKFHPKPGPGFECGLKPVAVSKFRPKPGPVAECRPKPGPRFESRPQQKSGALPDDCDPMDDFPNFDSAYDYFPARMQRARKVDYRGFGTKKTRRQRRIW